MASDVVMTCDKVNEVIIGDCLIEVTPHPVTIEATGEIAEIGAVALISISQKPSIIPILTVRFTSVVPKMGLGIVVVPLHDRVGVLTLHSIADIRQVGIAVWLTISSDIDHR